MTVDRQAAAAVRVEIDRGIGLLLLDRPPVNALDLAAQRALHSAAARVAADPDVRAVVLYGGPTIFSAGADIKEMARMTHAEMLEHAFGLQAAFTAVAEVPKPVIAALTGPVLGGGCELALAADFRIAGEHVTVGLPEIRLGVIPAAGGTQRLTRLAGPAVAKDLIYSGRVLPATEAFAVGLVDAVVPDGDVLKTALRRAESFRDGPATALAAAKTAVDAASALPLDTGLRVEREQFAALFATADREAGMRSFVESGPGRARFGRA